MERNLLIEILEDWNFWNRELETGKERTNYLSKCCAFLKSNAVLAIMGVRRSGKSYILRQFAKHLIKNGVAKEEILIMNFEDHRFAEFYPKLLCEIYELYIELLQPKGKPYILLDEVHNIPEWERWIRTIHELQKAKIIVSGSTAKLLSGELATVLTGRHLDLYIFPASFKEFLTFHGLETTEALDVVSKRIEIKRLFREYIEYGGFPEVILSLEKKRLLLTYIDDLVTKDVEKRHRIRKPEKLRALVRFYMTNIARPVTFRSIGAWLELSTDTVEKFSGYIEDAQLLFFVKAFSFKIKDQEKTPRKIYPIDVGLSNAIGFRFSENIGRLEEALVAIELRRKQLNEPTIEIFYWKDYNKEVDFVVKEGIEVKELIQVCHDISDREKKKYEIRALIKASRELKCRKLLVITADYEAEEKIKKKKINFIPLWKWLLAKI